MINTNQKLPFLVAFFYLLKKSVTLTSQFVVVWFLFVSLSLQNAHNRRYGNDSRLYLLAKSIIINLSNT